MALIINPGKVILTRESNRQKAVEKSKKKLEDSGYSL